MLYTKNGDNGKTSIYGCDQRISKSSATTEALGSLDETNSFLGVCKAQIHDSGFMIQDKKVWDIIHRVQNNLFTIQAQAAGADKKILEEDVLWLEKVISEIDKDLPEIKSFLISGANDISANFDFARTLARRAERRVVAVSEENITKIDEFTLSYMNRLSSFLYALARYFASKYGVEESPTY
ncbi:MAG: cob(I)yrinic acid a,c-diamide adenosyltransferase [Candidatus Paceibacterota bacterium]|nr:cob(I)yrinic acid a,c-diamide adenosyltransferase [Candidatus Paceibacterota bacterium]